MNTQGRDELDDILEMCDRVQHQIEANDPALADVALTVENINSTREFFTHYYDTQCDDCGAFEGHHNINCLTRADGSPCPLCDG